MYSAQQARSLPPEGQAQHHRLGNSPGYAADRRGQRRLKPLIAGPKQIRQRVPAMRDPLRSPWTRLALMVIFLAPLTVGFCLESRWLTQAGFIVLFVFILGVYRLRNAAMAAPAGSAVRDCLPGNTE